VSVHEDRPGEAQERTGSTQFLRWSVADGPAGRTVVLDGELDIAGAQGLSPVIHEAAEAGDVVVDMAALTFIDSTGLGLLVAAHNTASGAGHALTLRHPGRTVLRTMHIAGLDGVLTIEE